MYTLDRIVIRLSTNVDDAERPDGGLERSREIRPSFSLPRSVCSNFVSLNQVWFPKLDENEELIWNRVLKGPRQRFC